MKVYVITATVNSCYLKACVESVQEQDYSNIEHILIFDGVEPCVFDYKNISYINLPWNSGRNKYICHKIYAAIPHLLHEPAYIMFLDEDNTIEYNHVSSLVNLIGCGYDWAFSLRKIMDSNGKFICNDMCESLGNLSPTWLNPEDYLVDTSCYMIPVHIVRQFSECWQRQARANPEADRLFYHHLSKEYPNFKCSMQYSLCYRVGNRPDSVTGGFFLEGNKKKRGL